MRLTVMFFSAARASLAKASVSMPMGNTLTCIRRPSISHQSPLAARPALALTMQSRKLSESVWV
jgi:hypothetical protein